MNKNNVIPFRHPRQARDAIREQACDWLARLDAGADETDRMQLGAWLAEDAVHLEILLETAAFWDEAMVLEELAQIFPLAGYAPVKQARRKSLVALAAGVVIAVAMLAGIFSYLEVDARSADANIVAAVPTIYETAIGQQSTVTLPDGSTVILNTNTQIELAFSDATRNVYLQRGEAHFEISKDATRPFRVHAGSRFVEATGTAFTVQRLQENSIEVTVTEGSVNLRLRDTEVAQPAAMGQQQAGSAAQNAAADIAEEAAAETVEDNIPLIAGESAIVGEDADSIEKEQMQSEEIEVRLAWRHGMLLFQSEPLDQVLREVSRYTSIRIEADEAIRNIPVSAYIRSGDIDALLVAMRENFNIEAQQTSADHIQLRAQE